jgi:muramoyltetrapeptide carboxypeptidase LdcA involved in peptidoglycan recycling
MQNVIRPPRLRPGDSVGIVSPSWGGAGLFPHRVEQATRHLQSLGFQVKIAAHALNQSGFVSDSPENRAQDIHELLLDPEVKVIIAAIGGDHACHLLPLLDFDLLRQHPTAFMGFSDTTVLNVAIWSQTGLITFNGPAILTDFGEHPKMFDYTERYFLRALTRAEPLGRIEPSPWWTEEILKWEEKEDQKRPRARQPSPGWNWLREGRAEGTLIGGCLESLEHLRGTRFWPQWDEAIFFFETSEEKPPPERVDSVLMDYENMGVLPKLRGLIVGRPMNYSDAEKAQLDQVILERTKGYDFPIVTGLDFGHTAPQFSLPIGCRARIDSQQQLFEIIDPAVD